MSVSGCGICFRSGNRADPCAGSESFGKDTEGGFAGRDARGRSQAFDRDKALDEQIELLRLKKEYPDHLIDPARGIKLNRGKTTMDFSAFDTKKLDEYAARAKASWGTTPEYREFEQRTKGRTQAETLEVNARMMRIFSEFGAIRGEDPASEKAQQLVRKLKSFITKHFYTCSDQTLLGLGQMYAGGGEMTANIDRYGGEGTASFVHEAIAVYCGKQSARAES